MIKMEEAAQKSSYLKMLKKGHKIKEPMKSKFPRVAEETNPESSAPEQDKR